MIAAFALVTSSLMATSASASPSGGSAAHATSAATTTGSPASTPRLYKKTYTAGSYIVELKSQSVSTYTGGVKGYSATRPAKGHQLNAHSSAAQSYSKLLASKQSALTSKYGIKALAKYTIAYNGFGAKLSAAQATQLAKDPNVISITKDKLLKVQSTDVVTSKSSLNYLNIAGNSGLWSTIGGHAEAGKGIVVGDIDTGVAPENAAFAGDPLATCASEDDPGPCLSSPGEIQFVKADGQNYTTHEVAGASWTSSDYNQKLIGAQYFDQGFLDEGAHLASTTAAIPEYASPRDGDGHGSHTSSTAAGNFGNEASIDGTDYGNISGVAPAAKIAMYKACWTATIDELTGCSTIDLVAAINQAVTDGVDVINFSIGGDGGATTVYSPTDEAFLNAATAGIFVSAAAGNSGPDASTLDNASPWVTTVAASSIPSFAATVDLGDGTTYTGASITVNGSVNTGSPDTEVISGARLVLASAYAVKGKSSINVNGCNTGALKHVPANTVVVCDREGIIDRVTKSATVADAGGVGMILVNTIPEDVDADAHSVPTIHLDYSARAAIRAYAKKSSATVSFVPTTDDSPVPQVAGFSSRGPVTADGSNILKPDIAAPGVSILAAVANTPGGSGKYGLDSGTSMATPHITGLAALYLSQHPSASPASIKSAMMTTATNTVDAADADVTDPFVQGAGEVNPTDYLNPGLVYDSNATDWKAYLDGTGEASLGVDPINGSDLNEPSIAIGALGATQTVTRTVTAVTPGTYTGTITGLTGITATINNPSLTFAAAGDTATFTVTFTPTTALANKYATGFLTWTDGDTTVRSPIAVKPAAVDTTASGTGTNGHTTVSQPYGVTKGTNLHAYGLAAKSTVASSDPLTPAMITDGDFIEFTKSVTSSTTFIRFSSQATSGDDSTTKIELVILYKKTPSKNIGNYTTLIADQEASSSSQTVDINKPRAGSYLLLTFPIALESSVNLSDSVTSVKTTSGSGHFKTSPTTVPDPASSTGIQVRWGALPVSTTPYLGVIRYGSTSNYTLVTVDASTATAPENIVAPVVNGPFLAGKTLTSTAGTWNMSTQYFSSLKYQWFRNGDLIAGATKSTYKLVASDLTSEFTCEVTAKYAGLSTTATGGPWGAP